MSHSAHSTAPGVVASLASVVARGFIVDLRSLAVFRMAVALVVLGDVWVAWGNGPLLYTDDGLLPRPILFERHWPGAMAWSLHALGGSWAWQATLLGIEGLAALCLLAGWHTRLATIVCWVLVCSLELRNPLVTSGADTVLRLLLFWGMFLPLGACWSLDESRKPGTCSDDRNTLFSILAACFLMQIALIYVFSVACKTHPAWWSDGTALREVLELDVYVRPFGIWLRSHPTLCVVLTKLTVCLELFGPVIALLPVWRTGARLVAASAFFMLHGGIACCLDIGFFPYIMMAAWCAFLPGVVWDKLARRGSAADVEPAGRVPAAVPWPVNAFCGLCLAFVFIWNLRGTDFAFWERLLRRSVNPVALALRLEQQWAMFSPRPTRDDGWFILRAGLSDGREVDLLRDGGPVEWGKPPLISATFKDARWQKLLMNLWLQRYAAQRQAFGDCLAGDWNARHGGLSQVVAWQFWFVLERTQDDGSPGPPQPVLLHENERFGDRAPAPGTNLLRAGAP